jgi:hypothetical protein
MFFFSIKDMTILKMKKFKQYQYQSFQVKSLKLIERVSLIKS